ncbi:MAG TPA: hypothetical protein VF131_25490 [Blastocatellia bacterium]|nr:hypothetical protein [Blastocatellia bacterium]
MGFAVSKTGIRSSGKADQAASSSFISKLLHAHNFPQGSDALAATVTEARKANYYSADLRGKMPEPFDQKMRVCSYGAEFRREKCFSRGPTQQIDVFDRQGAHRLEILEGKSTAPVRQLEDWEFQEFKFNVLTFGILPLIKELQSSSVDADYLGSTGGGQEKIAVRINSAVWTIYGDEQHLIRKVEIVHRGHFIVIEYDDYRMVGDVNLPFSQRLYSNGRPRYELAFTGFNFKAAFPSGYFTRDALENERLRTVSYSQ